MRATEQYNELEILNLGCGQGSSVRELAEMIRERLDWSGDFTYDTSRPDGAPRKIFDVSRMKTALGWTPPTGLSDGIRKTIDWFLRARQASTTTR